MAIPPSATILHHLRQTVLRQGGAGLSDGDLLRSFLYRGDEAAFEALLRRQGPMVRGVCRRILRNDHDADDAFQAAFLVLIRKAPALATREMLGDWLHGVALRTALKARTAAARRRWKEQQAFRREAMVDEPDRSDWLPLIDQEINRLPPKYRLPVVLCDLEGRTRKQAAELLGWREGTLSGRLSRARAMLARRLVRRGITLSAAVLTAALAGEASARLPFSLVGPTCKAAMEFASSSAKGLVPAHVAALTEGVVKAMFVAKLKKITAVVTAALVLAAGVGAWHYAGVGASEERPRENSLYSRPVAAQAPKEEPARPIPPADRVFQIDLKIVERKNGQEKLLAEPQMRTVEGAPVSFTTSPGAGSAVVDLGGGKYEVFDLGPTVRCVARKGKKGKVRLDLMLSRATPLSFEDTTVVESKSVRQIADVALGEKTQLVFSMGGKPPSGLVISALIREVKQTVEKTVAEAESDLKAAENWRKKGHPAVACGYYLQIVKNYPDTIYAERAKERLAELNKPKEKPDKNSVNSRE